MTDQAKIWQHFQNTDHDSFAPAYPRLNFLLTRIAKHSRDTPAVLNIGVGGGYFELEAKKLGWQIHAADPDEQAITRLVTQGIDARVGTLGHLPFADASMDFVVASEVIEHLPDSDLPAALIEIHRVMKPGALFIGTVPHAEVLADNQTVCPHCGEVFHRWGHHQSFTLGRIREFLGARFTVQTVSRRAFITLWRSPFGFVKGIARQLLAKLGEPMAYANIWWVARKH